MPAAWPRWIIAHVGRRVLATSGINGNGSAYMAFNRRRGVRRLRPDEVGGPCIIWLSPQTQLYANQATLAA